MNNIEKVIRFLIDKYNEENENPIIVYRSDITTLNLSEDEVIKILNTLDNDNIISAKPKSPRKDFSAYWEITITSKCLSYFYDQKQNKISNQREWVITYIPITISLIALIISMISLILSLG